MAIHRKQYYRPPLDFNPTVNRRSIPDLIAGAYDYVAAVDKSLLKTEVLSSVKRKFVLYNSDLKVRYIRFLEVTFEDATENALFFPYFSPFKWLTV